MSWEDEREITRTLLRYCELLDIGEPERIAGEVYTDDVHVAWFGVTGREDVGTATVAARAPYERVIHVLSNIWIDIDGDTARASSYGTAWHWLKSTSHLGSRPCEWVTVTGYDDELRRGADGWRIARRRARNLTPGDLPIGLGAAPATSFTSGTRAGDTSAPAD